MLGAGARAPAQPYSRVRCTGYFVGCSLQPCPLSPLPNTRPTHLKVDVALCAVCQLAEVAQHYGAQPLPLPLGVHRNEVDTNSTSLLLQVGHRQQWLGWQGEGWKGSFEQEKRAVQTASGRQKPWPTDHPITLAHDVRDRTQAGGGLSHTSTRREAATWQHPQALTSTRRCSTGWWASRASASSRPLCAWASTAASAPSLLSCCPPACCCSCWLLCPGPCGCTSPASKQQLQGEFVRERGGGGGEAGGSRSGWTVGRRARIFPAHSSKRNARRGYAQCCHPAS